MRVLMAALGILALPGVAEAQEAEPEPRPAYFELWPEADGFLNISKRLRLILQTPFAFQPETGYQEMQVAGYVDFSLGGSFRDKGFLPSERWTPRPPSVRLGILQGAAMANGDYEETRLMADLVFRRTFKGRTQLSLRNRGEARWLGGDFSWRYRLRLRADRDITIRRYGLSPYLSAEPYYDSRSGTVARWEFTGGSEFPIRTGPLVLEANFTYRPDTAPTPQAVYAVAMIVNVYF